MKIIRQTKLVLILLSLCSIPSLAQKSNIWCFGDSAGLDFNNGIPFSINSSLDSRGTCVSVADNLGDLLFYANTRSATAGNTTGLIWDKTHQLMLNGDSIAGDGWYNEMIIVPNPSDDSLYYIFSIGVAIPFGVMYSIIDMRNNNFKGEVVQKNISLTGNKRMVDCVTAVKHGNGRDWWLIARESTGHLGISNNSWYTYLISPSGISNAIIQNVGTLNATNAGRLSFDSVNNKFCFVNLVSLIELYDFDRCTGIISNAINIEPPLSTQPYPWYWSCEFSASGQYLYVTSQMNPTSRLWQFDTWSANITASKTLIWQTSYPPYTAGALKRGPDSKIYLSGAWVDSSGAYYYPYPSFAYFPENMNLSVINSPDLQGLSCDLQPWSFFLGGKRTYWGLPNNPDYDLGPLVGSPCDTLVGINDLSINSISPELFVYFDFGWETAFINAEKLKGKNYRLSIYDVLGKEMFIESGKINSSYFTKNLDCSAFSKGMYLVVLQSDKEKLVKRFVIE